MVCVEPSVVSQRGQQRIDPPQEVGRPEVGKVVVDGAEQVVAQRNDPSRTSRPTGARFPAIIELSIVVGTRLRRPPLPLPPRTVAVFPLMVEPVMRVCVLLLEMPPPPAPSVRDVPADGGVGELQRPGTSDGTSLRCFRSGWSR